MAADIVTGRSLLCSMYPALKHKSGMHIVCDCLCNNFDISKIRNNNNKNSENNEEVGMIRVERALMDTGSLSANYVSEGWLRRFESKFSPQLVRLRERNTVFLAGKASKLESTEVVHLVLKMGAHNTDNDAKHIYEGKFIVIDMDRNDIIIGLPAILGPLFDLFIETMKSARHDYVSTTMDLNLLEDGVILEPWSHPTSDPAPEEELTPDIVNFAFALNYLEKTHDEAVLEFHALLEQRVSDNMKRETPVMQLMKEKGVLVFVPTNWNGIQKIPPLELRWKDGLPDRVKPRARPINPKIWDVAKKEMTRLQGYFYRESRSPIASPLVFAPKATPPYIRTCGDYTYINAFIDNGHFYIPVVSHELQKIIRFRVFLDIDMTNAFHQLRLARLTSSRLSVQTPWGQFEPIFMPEGISPGSLILQEVVSKIFGDFEEWTIVIFDNLLILADDYQDAYRKLDIFLDKCIEYNVVLKMSKSWIGVQSVNFFGYLCTHQKYELTEERKQSISNISFPEGSPKNKLTQLRRALGIGVFFKPFIPRYSEVAALLTDMTKKDFPWEKESEWKHDYRKAFENFKTALQQATALYFPDYAADWVLRTDASEVGVGGVLLQHIEVSGALEWQPIAFISHKFSQQAQRWTTIEQEGFAIFYCVFKLSYYLIGKSFTIETDHNNLLWMEQSMVPKIIRWKIYLQSFQFKIRHIAGRRNLVADWLSRLAEDTVDTKIVADCDRALNSFDEQDVLNVGHALHHLLLLHSSPADEKDTSVVVKDNLPDNNMNGYDAFHSVHNARIGHGGAKLTWLRLNKYFPGHGIPLQAVQNLVSECATCQKTRSTLEHALKPIIRHLKMDTHRSAVGIDNVEITPRGKNGETHIVVCINLFTKYVYLYPIQGSTALNLSYAIWSYWSLFGTTDLIVSDQGPDLTSEMFTQLKAWIGVRHQFSIANMHTNGAERTIKEVSRHLRAIVFDERLGDVFADPSILPAVTYILNSEKHSETGFTPFELTFGSDATQYYNLDGNQNAAAISNSFVAKLNEHLTLIRKISKEYQDKLVAERISQTPPNKQNKYSPGDLVLLDLGPKPHPKMNTRYKGPFEVISHHKNDVTCKHLVLGFVETFDVESLVIFVASREKAYDAALRDCNQYVIEEILQDRGDPYRRTSMEFLVKYADGDIRWVPYSKDLFDAIPFEHYVSRYTHLLHLKYTDKEAHKRRVLLCKQDIGSLTLGETYYVRLNWLGYDFISSLGLPDVSPKFYVILFKTSHYFHKTSRKRITVICPVLNNLCYIIDNYDAITYFTCTTFDSNYMVLFDEQMLKQYPNILHHNNSKA